MGSESEKGSAAAIAFEAGLTRRETTVFLLYADDGLSYPEIAGQLRISTHAVECHASNIRRKLLAEWERRRQAESLQDAVQELRERSAAGSMKNHSLAQLTAGRMPI